MGFQGGFMVSHRFWLVSMVFQGFYMVFWLVSMVFHGFVWFPWFFNVVLWFFMVLVGFHGFSWFLLVSMVFHGSRLVCHGSRLVFHDFSPECTRPKLYPGPTIQSRSAARRVAQDLVYEKLQLGDHQTSPLDHIQVLI